MIIDIISQIPFFNGLGYEELQKICAIGYEEYIEKGQVVFEKGDSGEHMYIIITGEILIFQTEDGEDIPIATLQTGAFFGEIALIDGQPRSASIKTVNACHFFVLDRTGFLNLLTSSIPILSQVMQELSRKVRNLSQDFVVSSLKKQHVEDQAEIKRHQAISQMVAGMAHEINTPISIAFQGATSITESFTQDTIAELAKDEEAKEELIDIFNAAKLIENSMKRADKLIHSFKNLSVRQATDILEQVNLKELIEELIVLFPAQGKGLGLTIEIDNRLEDDGLWLGYPGFLMQVLLNLINNAQIHAYSGELSARVKITLSDKMDHFVIQIQDFGCGISKDNIDQVFTAFYTTKRGQGGTGLGMAIVHNLVTSALSGSINISSELGCGTTITIELPKKLKARVTKKND